MEKIRISYKTDLKIFLFAYTVVSVISIMLFKVKTEIVFFLGLNLTLMFLMLIIYNYISYSSMYFSDKGLVFKKPFREKEILWEELNLEIKSKSKYHVKLVLKGCDFKRQMTVDYVSIDSLLELTKRYCPKDHDFNTIIDDFSKNQKKINGIF